MLVKQLVGRFAGRTVDMPFAVAQRCLKAGTAALPEPEAHDPPEAAEAAGEALPAPSRRRGRE